MTLGRKSYVSYTEAPDHLQALILLSLGIIYSGRIVYAINRTVCTDWNFAVVLVFCVSHRNSDRVRNKHPLESSPYLLCSKCQVMCGNITGVGGGVREARNRDSGYGNKKCGCLNLKRFKLLGPFLIEFRCSQILQSSEVTVPFNAQRRTYLLTSVICWMFCL